MVDKDEIIRRLTAEDVYGPLEGARKTARGVMVRCLLPTHTEKTASFQIHSNDLSFHCFGCGKGGSAIDFVMLRDGVDFGEALRMLAAKAGIDMDTGKGIYHRLYEITAIVQDIYAGNLQKNPAALAYLRETRGLTHESIDRFKLGCTNGVSIVQILKDKGYTDQEILDAGVATMKSGILRDLFYRRIIFPAVRGGKVRGFGGRVLEGDGDFKYINSPTGPIFKKSEFLYGLDSAAVREAGYAIIVEGNMDVIMCHQHGLRNATAPCGTALTEKQVELLRKYCDRAVLVFDGDKAGLNAARRAAKLLLDRRMNGTVVLLPEGQDPDSWLRGGNSLKPLITEALPVPVFLTSQFPDTRKMVFNSMLGRGIYESIEFLSYVGTPTEGNAFAELQARLLVESVFRSGKAEVVLRQGGIEVRRKDGFLAVFSKGRFLCYQPAGKDYRGKAAECVRVIRALKAKRLVGKGRRKEIVSRPRKADP